MRGLAPARCAMLLLAFALVCSATGCSTPTQGQATTPDVTPTIPTSSKPRPIGSSTSPTSVKPGAESPLAGEDPCSLLTSADRAQLGLKSTPKTKDRGDRRSCQFSENGYVFSVNLFDTAGLDSVSLSDKDVKPVPTVGQHKALRSQFGDICSISMELTATSMVGISGGDVNGDMQKACDTAMRGAQVVEPKLP